MRSVATSYTLSLIIVAHGFFTHLALGQARTVRAEELLRVRNHVIVLQAAGLVADQRLGRLVGRGEEDVGVSIFRGDLGIDGGSGVLG